MTTRRGPIRSWSRASASDSRRSGRVPSAVGRARVVVRSRRPAAAHAVPPRLLAQQPDRGRRRDRRAVRLVVRRHRRRRRGPRQQRARHVLRPLHGTRRLRRARRHGVDRVRGGPDRFRLAAPDRRRPPRNGRGGRREVPVAPRAHGVERGSLRADRLRRPGRTSPRRGVPPAGAGVRGPAPLGRRGRQRARVLAV